MSRVAHRAESKLPLAVQILAILSGTCSVIALYYIWTFHHAGHFRVGACFMGLACLTAAASLLMLKWKETPR